MHFKISGIDLFHIDKGIFYPDGSGKLLYSLFFTLSNNQYLTIGTVLN